MSAEILQIDVEAAQRRVERMRFHATAMNESAQGLLKVMHQAREMEDHLALGYASWPALLVDVFGQEPLRLAREVRREVVSEMSDAGMSTRAIAPLVGVSNYTVSKDLEGVRNLTPDPTPVEVEGMTVNPATGEVLDNTDFMRGVLQEAEDNGGLVKLTGPASVSSPTVTEHTLTEKVKTTVGLDGKEYRRPEPKPLPTGDEANRLNAIQTSKAIGSALESLLGLTFPNYRTGIITEWWPIGKDNVPPSQSELFTPSQLRHIAQGLIDTSNELEAHRV